MSVHLLYLTPLKRKIADYDDSMDGAPSSKRVRFKPSVGVATARSRGASLVPATSASCSRVASPARGQEEEEEEALLEGEEVVASPLEKAENNFVCSGI